MGRKRATSISDEIIEAEIFYGDDLSYEFIEANPTRYITYSNGAVMDRSAGHIVKAPPKGMNTFDNPETAKDAVQKRIKMSRAAAHQGLLNASNVGRNSLDHWSIIVERQARLAMDAKHGRDATNAAKFVGKATGFLGDGRQSPANDQNASFIHFSGDIATRIVDIINDINQNSGTIIER